MRSHALESIRSYPTKKELLRELQAELTKLINEREQSISSLPCSLGKTDGGGSGISDTTYRKAEKAMGYDPEIEPLRKRVTELKEEVGKVDRALAQLTPIAKTILEMREMPRFDERKMQWERTPTWKEIEKKLNYSRMQCARIYKLAVDKVENMLQNVT